MFKVWIFTVSVSATVMIYHEGQEDLEVCSASTSNARFIIFFFTVSHEYDLWYKSNDSISDQLCILFAIILDKIKYRPNIVAYLPCVITNISLICIKRIEWNDTVGSSTDLCFYLLLHVCIMSQIAQSEKRTPISLIKGILQWYLHCYKTTL